MTLLEMLRLLYGEADARWLAGYDEAEEKGREPADTDERRVPGVEH